VLVVPRQLDAAVPEQTVAYDPSLRSPDGKASIQQV
jgi:hypothetical protein